MHRVSLSLVAFVLVAVLGGVEAARAVEAADAGLISAIRDGDGAGVRTAIERGARRHGRGSGRHDAAPLGGARRRRGNRRAAPRCRGRSRGRQPVRSAADLARLHQRQRGDCRAAPRRRRRSRYGAHRRGDGADDGGAHRSAGRRPSPARPRRERERGRDLAGADGAHVGRGRGTRPRHPHDAVARRGRGRSLHEGLDAAPVRRSRGAHRGGPDAARGRGGRRGVAAGHRGDAARRDERRACGDGAQRVPARGRERATTSWPPCSWIAAPTSTSHRGAGPRSTRFRGCARPASPAATTRPLPAPAT